MFNDDIRKNVPARVIQFSPPDISELEINEVAEALRSGWITTGPRTKELERRLAEYCHTSKTVCLNSATAAEELNFRICGIEPGDEVIVPAYTYTASASAPIHCGAKVVFVDSQKDNCEMDYDKVAEAITEKTKAVKISFFFSFSFSPCIFINLSFCSNASFTMPLSSSRSEKSCGYKFL